MKAVFRTPKNSTSGVDIVGVGYAGPRGEGEVVVEEAALRMHELQDEEGKPLSGSKLTAAAKEWAAARGLEVANVKNEEVEEIADLDAAKSVAEQQEAAKPEDTAVEDSAATGEEK